MTDGKIEIFVDGRVYRAEIPLSGTVFEEPAKYHPRALDGVVVGYGSMPEDALADAVRSLGKICLDCMFDPKG